MQNVVQDLRFAIRVLLKNPAFTAIAVLSIALGIGANSTVFSVVNQTLLKSLPYKDPDRLALIWGYSEGEGKIGERNQVSATDTADFRSQNTVFEDVSTYTGWMPIVSGEGEAERIPAIQVGDGFFKVMKGEPLLGRVFTPEEQQNGKDFVIVLGYGLWQRRFGGDPSIVGKTIQLNSRPYTIIGVMTADFHPLPSTLVSPEGQFYRPVAESYDENQRSARHLRAIARLKQGVSIGQAQAEMRTIAEPLEKEHPQSNRGRGARVASLTEDTVGGIRSTLLLLSGAVLFVLLIACANVGNLLLAKSTARQKEISIRTALGASRGRLIRQLLTESVLLALAGGALGVLITLWGVSIIENFAARINPLLTGIQIDFRVLAFTFVLAILTGLIFGLAPALHASKADLTETLKEGGRSSNAGASRNRLRGALIIAEVAMTLVLLVCAGLLIKTVMKLRQVNTGFNSQNVLTMNIGLPQVKYPKDEDAITFYKQVLEKIEGLPGVKGAGITTVLPLSGNFDGRAIYIEDQPVPRGEEKSADLYVTTPDYLRAMEIPIVKGRGFDARDIESSMKVALINETMARQLWGDTDPIGKRIALGNDTQLVEWRTIVGVVSDVSQYALDEKPPMQFYLPHTQFPTRFNNIVVKTSNNSENLIAAVRNEILAVDQEQAAFNIITLEKLYADSISLRRFFMTLLIAFAALALSLAAVGIYGVISYSVTQRTQEIGIRMALGARGRDVVRLVVNQGLTLTAAGISIGLGAAYALTRLLSGLLFGVTATDAITFITVPAVLIVVALVACLVPAYKASRTDPMTALRYE